MFPPFFEMPYTYTLCGLIILSSIAGLYIRRYQYLMLFHPYAVWNKKRLYTLLSSGFVHKSWLHLVVNIYLFYGAARDVEYIILEKDHSRTEIILIYLLLFFVTLIIPNLITGYARRSKLEYTSVGFSGVVFGFIGFSLLYLPLDHSDTTYLLLPFLHYSYEFAMALFMVLIAMAILFKKTKTNHAIHLWGFMVGILMAFMIRPKVLGELWLHFVT